MGHGFAPELESTRDKLKMTAKQTRQKWMSCFETLEDPRGRQGREHDFLSNPRYYLSISHSTGDDRAKKRSSPVIVEQLR